MPRIDTATTGKSLTAVYANVAVAETATMTWDLQLVGPVSLKLFPIFPIATVHFVAQLLDVDSGGFANVLSVGTGAPPPGNDSEPIRIDFGDVAFRIPRGHRVRILLAGQSADPGGLLEEDGVEIASAALAFTTVQRKHPDF